MGKKGRPQLEDYFGERAQLYGDSDWMARNQQQTTLRALSLLNSEYFSNDHPNTGGPLVALDLGCGTGYSSEILAKENYRVYGIDLSWDMIQQNTSNSFRCLADIRHLPFRSKFFDFILSISAFNFVTQGAQNRTHQKELIKTAISELARVLKPTGKVVIEFYPKETEIEDYLTVCKSRVFSGGLFIDHPDTKREKKYLLLEKIKKRCF